jgi:glycosyltransferase involved in cell wall biosynthesis
MRPFKNRIMVIGPLPPPIHGVTVFTESLIKSNLVQNFQIIHLDTSDHRNLDNIGCFDLLNVAKALKHTIQLIAFCLTKRPDIVYLPNSQNELGYLRDGIFILATHFFSRAKIIMHYHGGESFIDFRANTNRIMKWFISLTLRKVEVAIVLGERLRYIFSDTITKISVIPNGIFFNPGERPTGNKKSLQVSFLSNFFRSKGILNLLEAASVILKSHSDIHFCFVGVWPGQEPETRREAMDFVKCNNLEYGIKFRPPIINYNDKRNFFFNTDIFVFPSWNDSFGLVNIEAMAAGCPVISSRNVGAISEVVIDGITGILVTPKNSLELARGITRLIENPRLRKDMGMAGRRRYLSHFTLDKNITELSKLFRQTLGRSNP